MLRLKMFILGGLLMSYRSRYGGYYNYDYCYDHHRNQREILEYQKERVAQGEEQKHLTQQEIRSIQKNNDLIAKQLQMSIEDGLKDPAKKSPIHAFSIVRNGKTLYFDLTNVDLTKTELNDLVSTKKPVGFSEIGRRGEYSFYDSEGNHVGVSRMETEKCGSMHLLVENFYGEDGKKFGHGEQTRSIGTEYYASTNDNAKILGNSVKAYDKTFYEGTLPINTMISVARNFEKELTAKVLDLYPRATGVDFMSGKDLSLGQKAAIFNSLEEKLKAYPEKQRNDFRSSARSITKAADMLKCNQDILKLFSEKSQKDFVENDISIVDKRDILTTILEEYDQHRSSYYSDAINKDFLKNSDVLSVLDQFKKFNELTKGFETKDKRYLYKFHLPIKEKNSLVDFFVNNLKETSMEAIKKACCAIIKDYEPLDVKTIKNIFEEMKLHEPKFREDFLKSSEDLNFLRRLFAESLEYQKTLEKEYSLGKTGMQNPATVGKNGFIRTLSFDQLRELYNSRYYFNTLNPVEINKNLEKSAERIKNLNSQLMKNEEAYERKTSGCGLFVRKSTIIKLAENIREIQQRLAEEKPNYIVLSRIAKITQVLRAPEKKLQFGDKARNAEGRENREVASRPLTLAV